MGSWEGFWGCCGCGIVGVLLARSLVGWEDGAVDGVPLVKGPLKASGFDVARGALAVASPATGRFCACGGDGGFGEDCACDPAVSFGLASGAVDPGPVCSRRRVRSASALRRKSAGFSTRRASSSAWFFAARSARLLSIAAATAAACSSAVRIRMGEYTRRWMGSPVSDMKAIATSSPYLTFSLGSSTRAAAITSGRSAVRFDVTDRMLSA